MSEKNRRLSDFGDGANQGSMGDGTREPDSNENPGSKDNQEDNTSSDSSVCDCYIEKREEYSDQLNELSFTVPKCGHCIGFLYSKKPSTAAKYNYSLRYFIEYIHNQGHCIEDTEFVDVRDYFESCAQYDLAKSTLQADQAAIKGVISRYEAVNKEIPAVSWKIQENIDVSDYTVDEKYSRNGLTDEEIKKLIASLNTFRDRLLVLTNLETGGRSKSIRVIKLSDIDLEKEIIALNNTKVGGEYILPLTDDLTELVKHWVNNIRSSYVIEDSNQYLFPSKYGGHLSGEKYKQVVDEAARDAGIQEVITKIPVSRDSDEFHNKLKIDVHAFRHTFRRLMKHQDISGETQVYAMDHSRDQTTEYGKEPEECRQELTDKFDGVDISSLLNRDI